MNNDISQIRHLPPRDLRVRLNNLVRDVSRSFSDDCKIPYYGIDRLRIFAKLLETHARGVTENLFYRINYVRDAKFPSSMRHEQPRSEYLFSTPCEGSPASQGQLRNGAIHLNPFSNG